VIVDTSALAAILFDEPEGRELFDLIDASDSVGISAANEVEFSIVIARQATPTQRMFGDRLRSRLGVHVIPVTAPQAEIAADAYRTFGRGSGHAAKLNFGDCFAYALAIDRDEPLLFVGDDFAHTDVRRAR
jgi:ribonuclease VapC